MELSLILNSLYKMCIVNISPSACSRGRDSAGHLRGGGDHGAAGVRQVGYNIIIISNNNNNNHDITRQAGVAAGLQGRECGDVAELPRPQA